MAWVVATVTALCAFAVCGLALVLRPMLLLRREPDTFRCKIRVSSGWLPSFKTTWPKRVSRAAWASNVLIVFRGPAEIRVHAMEVASAHGAVHTLPRREVARLGPEPLALDLILENGCRLEVAAPARSRTLLCGPYLVPQALPNRPNRRSRRSR